MYYISGVVHNNLFVSFSGNFFFRRPAAYYISFFTHSYTHTHTHKEKSHFFFPFPSLFFSHMFTINFISPDYNSLLKKKWSTCVCHLWLISFNHFVYFLLPWINFFLWTVFVCLDIFKNYLSSIFSFPTSEFTRMYVVPVYVCACFSLLFSLF